MVKTINYIHPVSTNVKVDHLVFNGRGGVSICKILIIYEIVLSHCLLHREGAVLVCFLVMARELVHLRLNQGWDSLHLLSLLS